MVGFRSCGVLVSVCVGFVGRVCLLLFGFVVFGGLWVVVGLYLGHGVFCCLRVFGWILSGFWRWVVLRGRGLLGICSCSGGF